MKRLVCFVGTIEVEVARDNPSPPDTEIVSLVQESLAASAPVVVADIEWSEIAYDFGDAWVTVK